MNPTRKQIREVKKLEQLARESIADLQRALAPIQDHEGRWFTVLKQVCDPLTPGQPPDVFFWFKFHRGGVLALEEIEELLVALAKASQQARAELGLPLPPDGPIAGINASVDPDKR